MDRKYFCLSVDYMDISEWVTDNHYYKNLQEAVPFLGHKQGVPLGLFAIIFFF